jgi:DNA-binding Lrp family transcriptional regulator
MGMDSCAVNRWLSSQPDIQTGLAISNSTLSEITGLSERTVKRRLSTLSKSGLFFTKRYSYPLSPGKWAVTRIIYKKD